MPSPACPNGEPLKTGAKRQLSAAARYRFSFWVVAADVDHFNTVNDTYGHEASDTVLKTFSEILQANSRSSDICGRVGGEEFLCVITHASKQNARLAVERIRLAYKKQDLSLTAATWSSRQLLAWPASKDRACLSFGELVARADAALYSTKRQGRNRLEIAESEVG